MADKCACGKEYDPACDYKQGRCPNHPPMIKLQPKDTSKGHFYVSLVKSFLRIGAGSMLIGSFFIEAGWLFIVAEALGIIEEMV